ncbi:MAG: CBS domain-containing protein [Candidatus Krumholzibacteria bacterium]|nr:CBS domain-containing protein [Candidatus Krumholzibacteria bacterium]
MHSNTIKDVLKTQGGRPVISAAPDAMVFDAVRLMVEKNIGSLLIIEDGNICGIMSERDYLRLVTTEGRTAHDTPVHELMTRQVVYVTPETKLPEVMAIMTEKRIRHVPVMVGDELMGIVSIGDVVKQIGQNQTAQIRVLEEYISDDYPGPAPDSHAR